jgi:hypothetical protein
MEQKGELNLTVPEHIRVQIILVSNHTLWKMADK